MKVWIDILTPKQVLFLGALATRLERSGHEVMLTTRRYREVNQMLDMKEYKAKIVGEHGGPSVFNKLRQSAFRIVSLAKLINRSKPSVAVSFSSPEAARVAYGLSIPHYCLSDSPHATAVSKLSVPLSKRLFTPWIIPKDEWTRFGISRNNIIRYRALDPVVWVKGLKPSKSVLKKLKLDEDKPIVTVRPEETYAAYLLQKSSPENLTTKQVVQNLMAAEKDLQIVIIGRYGREFTRRWRGLCRNVMFTESVVDGPSLVAHSSLFIGAGGTMTAEAALLGVPTISIYPSDPTFVEKYLIKAGLVYRNLVPEQVVTASRRMISDVDFQRRYRAESKRLLNSMEDPIAVITKHLTNSVK